MKRIGVERSVPPFTTLFLLLTLLPHMVVDLGKGSRILLDPTSNLIVGSGTPPEFMAHRVAGDCIPADLTTKCGLVSIFITGSDENGLSRSMIP